MNKFLLHFVFLIFISLQTAGFSQIANEAILSIDSDELEYIRKDLSPWETAVYPSIIFDDQEFKYLKKILIIAETSPFLMMGQMGMMFQEIVYIRYL